jgi:hyperosmotically inducible protein
LSRRTISRRSKLTLRRGKTAAANARITAAIKTKLVADSGLAAFKIDVDTTDGVVTLSGTVTSPEDIARAMKLAMEVEGVHRVVSTLLVKPS